MFLHVSIWIKKSCLTAEHTFKVMERKNTLNYYVLLNDREAAVVLMEV